jgi:hypothetical protein
VRNKGEVLLPLGDGDIIAYEAAFAGQYREKDEETGEWGEIKILPFTAVKEKIERMSYDLMDTLDTYLEPIMFLTGEDNFREEIAKRKGYKENRDRSKRPYHLENARNYITARYNTATSRGCEADDLLAIAQTRYNRLYAEGKSKVRSVICTRDKDLRQVPGLHYGWEMHNQPEFPLTEVDELGTLTPTYIEKVSKKTGKTTKSMKPGSLKGTGAKWFYTQALIGDITDNIPGLKGYGQVTAYTLMDKCKSEDELIDTVVAAFKKVYGDAWHEELYEQVRLVYMIREQNEDGSLQHWELPRRFYGG